MSNSSGNDEHLRREPLRQSDLRERAALIFRPKPTQGAHAASRPIRKSGSYDTWTVVELKRCAKELGLTGYSSLNKEDLIDHLRSR